MECTINYVYRLAKDVGEQVEERGKGFYPTGYVDEAVGVAAENDDAEQESGPSGNGSAGFMTPLANRPIEQSTPRP